MAGTITGPVTFTTAGKRVPAYLQDPLRWPLAGGWDALAAGTHRSRPDNSGNAVPPYVPRDQDAVIRARLTRAADEGGLVLVVGESTAGKTRACFEALRAQLPEHRVVAPVGGPDLLTAVEVIDRTTARCVVWLDDLESCLGPDGLGSALLAELIRLRIPVLATMRHQQFEIFAAPETTPGASTEHARTAIAGARVLRQLDPVQLDRVWSADELERAGEAEDDRIADALTHHGTYGIAEYLAAGPALLQEWHRANSPGGHPRAAALIAAAVDLARTGLRPPTHTTSSRPPTSPTSPPPADRSCAPNHSARPWNGRPDAATASPACSCPPRTRTPGTSSTTSPTTPTPPSPTPPGTPPSGTQ
ncbi:hypothetical protein [Streptomyces sp. DH7]|uniref:hypothetical protein n=1 Tax=Streptomyces sp. DH7 TaxID=2857006 RepID=UPI001E585B39|nr:hypothetical protein [Streptomyces sp. DH7]